MLPNLHRGTSRYDLLLLGVLLVAGVIQIVDSAGNTFMAKTVTQSGVRIYPPNEAAGNVIPLANASDISEEMILVSDFGIVTTTLPATTTRSGTTTGFGGTTTAPLTYWCIKVDTYDTGELIDTEYSCMSGPASWFIGYTWEYVALPETFILTVNKGPYSAMAACLTACHAATTTLAATTTKAGTTTGPSGTTTHPAVIGQYCVSGAGEPNANGTYNVGIGWVNGQPFYANATGYALWYQVTGLWNISQVAFINTGFVYYVSDTSAITGGWSTSYGIAPAPTIVPGVCATTTLQGTTTAPASPCPATLTVSGAGTTDANGTYSFAGVANGILPNSYALVGSAYWIKNSDPTWYVWHGSIYWTVGNAASGWAGTNVYTNSNESAQCPPNTGWCNSVTAPTYDGSGVYPNPTVS